MCKTLLYKTFSTTSLAPARFRNNFSPRKQDDLGWIPNTITFLNYFMFVFICEIRQISKNFSSAFHSSFRLSKSAKCEFVRRVPYHYLSIHISKRDDDAEAITLNNTLLPLLYKQSNIGSSGPLTKTSKKIKFVVQEPL